MKIITLERLPNTWTRTTRRLESRVMPLLQLVRYGQSLRGHREFRFRTRHGLRVVNEQGDVVRHALSDSQVPNRGFR